MPLEVMLAATAPAPSFRLATTRSATQRDLRLLGIIALISHRNMLLASLTQGWGTRRGPPSLQRPSTNAAQMAPF